MTILFTGGGTMGSVTPLLATAERLTQHELHFVGTRRGPEGAVIRERGNEFTAIMSAKFRRYISPWQLLVPFQLLVAMWQSWRVLRRVKPDVIVGAGSFVDVPVVWVGRLLRIPCIIHQQDVQPGLAITLMAPFASTITVAFEESLHDFPRAEWIGNPVRDLTPTTSAFTLDKSVPTVMIMGGGTGAQAINELVTSELCESANVIHVTGHAREGKMEHIDHPRYHKREFLGEEMKEALQKADVVVSRAGLGSITELAALHKPSIIIPMPQSHQERNAQLLTQEGAAIVLDQHALTPDTFRDTIVQLIEDSNRQEQLRTAIGALMPEDATAQFVKRITELA